MVGRHHAARMPHHLTCRAGRHLDAVVVDQADVVPRCRPTHGVQLVRMQMCLKQTGAATLCHAVELDQTTRPALEHIGLERGAKRRAGGELHAVAGEVKVVEPRVSHQPLVLHRHQHGVGDVVLLRQRQVLRRFELGHQHQRAAGADGGEKHHQRGIGVQGRGQQGDGVGAITVSGASAHMAPAHAMGLHDALGLAGRAR